MRIYFLRHGIAEDVSASGTDRDRELTPDGIDEMEREAEGIKRLNLDLDLVLSSPYPRASATAEMVTAALGITDNLLIDPRLAPGFRLGDLQQIVAGAGAKRRIMLVGHNFDLPTIAAQLVGGGRIDLKKGGLIRVDTEEVEPGRGALKWVLSPKHLIAMGEP